MGRATNWRFQFLIGKIKSVAVGSYYATEVGFQFLIGKIKSLIIVLKVFNPVMFQFLIGKIKSFSAFAAYLLYLRFNSS